MCFFRTDNNDDNSNHTIEYLDEDAEFLQSNANFLQSSCAISNEQPDPKNVQQTISGENESTRCELNEIWIFVCVSMYIDVYWTKFFSLRYQMKPTKKVKCAKSVLI